MSQTVSIALSFSLIAGACAIPDQASAHRRNFPLTRCGPYLDYLCPIHGYFDLAPFQYNLAIHPGCIKIVRVDTPYGVRRERAIVCG
jgi:hypothetical protein